MTDKVVALGRAKTDPDPRIVRELERYLKLAKEGRISDIVISALVPHPTNWEDDEIQSRWFQAHVEASDYIKLLGVAANLQNAISQRLYEMGYTPDETPEDDGE